MVAQGAHSFRSLPGKAWWWNPINSALAFGLQIMFSTSGTSPEDENWGPEEMKHMLDKICGLSAWNYPQTDRREKQRDCVKGIEALGCEELPPEARRDVPVVEFATLVVPPVARLPWTVIFCPWPTKRPYYQSGNQSNWGHPQGQKRSVSKAYRTIPILPNKVKSPSMLMRSFSQLGQLVHLDFYGAVAAKQMGQKVGGVCKVTQVAHSSVGMTQK